MTWGLDNSWTFNNWLFWALCTLLELGETCRIGVIPGHVSGGPVIFPSYSVLCMASEYLPQFRSLSKFQSGGEWQGLSVIACKCVPPPGPMAREVWDFHWPGSPCIQGESTFTPSTWTETGRGWLLWGSSRHSHWKNEWRWVVKQTSIVRSLFRQRDCFLVQSALIPGQSSQEFNWIVYFVWSRERGWKGWIAAVQLASWFGVSPSSRDEWQGRI